MRLVGVVLALGRRSKLPVIHWISMINYRAGSVCSVNTVLFMGAVTLLPIFLRAGPWSLISYSSAWWPGVFVWLARTWPRKTSRGLQAIPKGQYESRSDASV